MFCGSFVTDKLKSYAAAKRQILPSVEHRQSRYLNNRAELSHQPTRRRERQMKRFHVSASCAALPLHPQSDPQPFPTPPSSPQCQPVSHGSQCRLLHVARCCRSCACNRNPLLLFAHHASATGNLTMPAEEHRQPLAFGGELHVA